MNALFSAVLLSLASASLAVVTITDVQLLSSPAGGGASVPAKYLDFTPPVIAHTLQFSFVQSDPIEGLVSSVEILINNASALTWMFGMDESTALLHPPLDAATDAFYYLPADANIPAPIFQVVMTKPTAAYEGKYTIEITTTVSTGGLKETVVASHEVPLPAIRYCPTPVKGVHKVEDSCKLTVAATGCPEGHMYGSVAMGSLTSSAKLLKDGTAVEEIAFMTDDLQADGSFKYTLAKPAFDTMVDKKKGSMKYELVYKHGDQEALSSTVDVKCGAGSLSVSIGFLMGMLVILKSVV